MVETFALGRTAKREGERGLERSPYLQEPVDHEEDWLRPPILALASLLKLNLLGSESVARPSRGSHAESQRAIVSRISDPDSGGSSSHRIDGRARSVRSPVQ